MAVSGQTAAQAVLDPPCGPGSVGPKLAHEAGLELVATAARASRTRARSDGHTFMKTWGYLRL